MKTVILFYSKHHGNTKKLLDAIATANRLWRALNSRHPYRAFKDAINDTGMANKYYDFRSLTFRRMAEEWCRDHKVRYYVKE